MRKKIKIGSWITLGHFSIAEVMRDAGFDWLCIDLEHSVIDYYEMEQLIASIDTDICTPYVRVSANDPIIIKRVLDAGAKGIIVPMVNNKDDAEKIVNSVKYPPLGKRGVGLGRAQGYGFEFETYTEKIIDQIKIIAQIEHIDAINNLEDILSVNGIDGTIIGPYDLSGSMGKPGKYDDDDVKKVIAHYEDISLKLNKTMGYHVIEPNHKLVLEKINAGYEFIAFSLDTLFLGTICRDELGALRKELKWK